MFHILQVVTVILVAVGMTPALAHALELPGKKRLTQDQYLAVQRIYYPGFTTVGGIGEVGGMIATLVLLMLTPQGSDFWLTLIAFLGLLAMHAVYWIVTHPVNQYWLRGQALGSFGSGFFSLASARGTGDRTVEWTELRDRWEYSHVVRAVLSLLSLVALVIAVS
ncbi:MAG: anthrone oxygenase family protein [Gemmatimonadales bacterium]